MRSPSPRSLPLMLLVAGLALCAVASAAEPASGEELLARARAVYESAGPADALPLFERALAAFRAAGDRHGEAIALGLVGNCHKRLGDLDRALALLSQALAMKRELGDRLEEGKTLSHLGLVYWERGEYPEAILHLERAVAIGAELGDAKLEGSALNNLALVHDELGDYEKSLATYRRALELYRATDFPRGEGDTLGNLGGVHLLLGRFREAMGYYRQALAVSERLGSTPAMSQDLGNLAICHAGLGEIDAALADFDRALALARAAGLAKEEADWLRGKGAALVATGRHTEGLALFVQALARYEASGLARERIEALQQLAEVQLELGDLAAAESLLQQSLAQARAIEHPRGVLEGLLALGGLEARRGRGDVAGALYAEALAGARDAGDRGLEAACEIRRALLLCESGRPLPARDAARRALDLARAERTAGVEAEALFALGEAERRAGDLEAALAAFTAGEWIGARLGQPDVVWRLARGSGRALEALGREEEALAAYRRAVDHIESVRARLREERYRAGYIEERYEAYIDLVRLLLRRGREEEAFSTSERLRAKSYLDLLSRDPAPGLTPEQRRTATELRERIRALERALEAESRAPGGEERQGAALVSRELAAAERDYETFLDGLRRADPALAASWTLAIPSVAELGAALEPDMALVEFVAGDREVTAFVLTRDGLRSHVAPLERADLEAKVTLLRELVRRRDSDAWRAPAASLAAQLIAPLERAGWLAGKRRLLLVPHGVLHHLPFALLPHGPDGRPLVADYSLATLPAAGALTLAVRGSAPPGTILALAPARAHLAHAPAEARAVAAAHPEPKRLLLGAAATESAFKSAAAGYRVLHLATHSRWNPVNPLLSGLELEPGGGEDGRLEVHEILDLQLGAGLVALSACETALGGGPAGALPAGDDFVGLTRAFLHAGAGGVLASLWEVDDRSTLELMRLFYARLPGEGPAAALAAAQRALLAGPDPELAHPYHWAPFVLVGAPKTPAAEGAVP